MSASSARSVAQQARHKDRLLAADERDAHLAQQLDCGRGKRAEMRHGQD